MELALFSLLILINLTNSKKIGVFEPQQVHIALGVTIDKISVTWSTRYDTVESIVVYGIDNLESGNETIGTSSKFVDATGKNVQYLHHVTLSGLKPATKYTYICGSKGQWSPVYTFTTMKAGNDWSPRFVFYGDLGFINSQSVPRLDKDIQNGMYDVALHVGDFAYNLDTYSGTTGDNFMNIIQPVAANLPYMTCPGNHEFANNFTQYKRRFFMPGDENGDRMYYSFNVGPIHIISFSTEYFFDINYGIMQIPRMFEWLKNDLRKATINRNEQPWIVTMAHRPMYCSNDDRDDCTHHESLVRVGVPILHIFGLEDLFNEYGVDLMLWAHEHSYERLWPIYNREVYNGSRQYPYTNPGAPVHIITGSAGCQENIDPFDKDRPYWSAKRIPDYGYTRMAVINRTHLYMEQVSDSKGGSVADQMWLIKEKHGPYPTAMKFRQVP
ncbi:hypothetical protein LOTGIDRAFT_150028 [Lottia gigantea]|uniref:Purple acid phosphatase n=1 Tax=Lottia gigantea TaxID=225164 RepID=V4AHM2_LOTGI|nr:hypothetical protein LOTGIDRAFT_150028 [Lottia gigantea]ESO96417.1 hypothetical protein LOTGIDRAFT_150028 [Lottia gigantea]